VLGYNEDVEVRHALRLEYNLTGLVTDEFSKRQATHWAQAFAAALECTREGICKAYRFGCPIVMWVAQSDLNRIGGPTSDVGCGDSRAVAPTKAALEELVPGEGEKGTQRNKRKLGEAKKEKKKKKKGSEQPVGKLGVVVDAKEGAGKSKCKRKLTGVVVDAIAHSLGRVPVSGDHVWYKLNPDKFLSKRDRKKRGRGGTDEGGHEAAVGIVMGRHKMNRHKTKNHTWFDIKFFIPASATCHQHQSLQTQIDASLSGDGGVSTGKREEEEEKKRGSPPATKVLVVDCNEQGMRDRVWDFATDE
jgi:hypothetical protein